MATTGPLAEANDRAVRRVGLNALSTTCCARALNAESRTRAQPPTRATGERFIEPCPRPTSRSRTRADVVTFRQAPSLSSALARKVNTAGAISRTDLGGD